MAGWLEAFWDVVSYGGKAGIDELRDRARDGRRGAGTPGGPISIPQLADLVPDLSVVVPRLDSAVPRIGNAVPRLPGRPALAAIPAAAGAGEAGPSYAEEFGGLGYAAGFPNPNRIGYDDKSPVACWPCTVRHVNTMAATAAQGARGARDPREAAIVVRGECEVWLEYDVTPERLAATSPARRGPIQEAARQAPGLLELLPEAPGRPALAWAAAGEAERMLRGDPSELERMAAHQRLHDVQGWIGDMDTIQLPAEAAPHLTDVRKARHRLNADEAEGLISHVGAIQARDALWGLAMATTPAPSPEDMQAVARHTKAMQERFTRQAFNLTSKRPPAGPAPAPKPARVYRDIEYTQAGAISASSSLTYEEARELLDETVDELQEATAAGGQGYYFGQGKAEDDLRTALELQQQLEDAELGGEHPDTVPAALRRRIVALANDTAESRYAARERPPGGRMYEDRETRPPGQLVDLVARGDFLGSTERSRTAFRDLDAFNEARGVNVRDYPLAPGIEKEGGQPYVAWVSFGAYSPAENAILLGPQVFAEAPRDVETIGEETAHALLNSDHCNVWGNTANLAYGDQPEEREAKLANTLALLQAGIPFEDSFGRKIDSTAVRLDTERLERTEDPRIVRRAKWAAGVMEKALRGDVAGAAASSAACPR